MIKPQRGLQRGAAFPPNPVAHQLFYRTDATALCVYDGTYWLSEEVFYFPLHNYRGSPPWDVTSEALASGVPFNNPPYLMEWSISYYVDGNGGVSDYWNITLRALNADVEVVDLATFNTAPSDSVWVHTSTTTFTEQPAPDYYWIQLFLERVNDPGPISITNSLLARRILG